MPDLTDAELDAGEVFYVDPDHPVRRLIAEVRRWREHLCGCDDCGPGGYMSQLEWRIAELMGEVPSHRVPAFVTKQEAEAGHE